MHHTCHLKVSIGLLVFNSKYGPSYHYWWFFIDYLIYLFKMIFFNDINNVITKVLLCFKISFCLFFFFFFSSHHNLCSLFHLFNVMNHNKQKQARHKLLFCMRWQACNHLWHTCTWWSVLILEYISYAYGFSSIAGLISICEYACLPRVTGTCYTECL